MYLCQDGLIETVGSSDIHDSCITYMTTFTLCLTLIVMNGVIAGILNGQGAAGLSTAMMMTLAIGNMILDPILIYGLDMGIVGASLATVLATVMSILVGIRYLLGRRTYLSFGRSSLRMNVGHMREIGKAGIPQMLEFVVIYGMDAVLNMIIIICAGSEGLTIFSTPDAIVYIMVVPAIAIESTLVAVASSAYGQGDVGRMRDAYVFSVKLGIGVIVGLVILVEIMPAVFMMPFTYSGDMADLKPQLVDTMRILALYAPFFSMTPICSAFLQAMKHPTYSVVLAIVRNLILIGLFWIAAGISLTAICWFLVIGHIIGATIVTSVTLLTYRGVRRSMSAQAA
jgi:Na+-driven multidrug efflux pump